MVLNKTIGYLMLSVGLILIGWTLFYSYNIFTVKASAPLIFKTPVQQSSNQSAQGTDLQAQIQIQIQNAVNQQVSNILPAESITKILNLISWSIFAFVLLFAGGIIAGIGEKMVR